MMVGRVKRRESNKIAEDATSTMLHISPLKMNMPLKNNNPAQNNRKGNGVCMLNVNMRNAIAERISILPKTLRMNISKELENY